MGNRQEVKIQTQGPNGGNLTPKRQGRRPGAYRVHVSRRTVGSCVSARGGLVEVIGACPSRTKVKRRKACAAGEPALSGEARYPPELRMYWRRDVHEVCCHLPGEICRVPRKR